MAADIAELHGLLGVQAPIYTPEGLAPTELGYITTETNSIVDVRVRALGYIVARARADLREKESGGPNLHLVMPNAAFDNRSYQVELRRQGRAAGVRVHVHQPDSDEEAIDIVSDLSDPDRTDVHGIVTLLPTLKKEGETVIRQITHPDRDPDGASGKIIPATSVAMLISGVCLDSLKPETEGRKALSPEEQTLAAYERFSGRTIGVSGMGALTNKPLVEGLLCDPSIGADNISVILATRGEVEDPEQVARLAECDVVFAAARRAAYIHSTDLSPNAVAVDVGNTPRESDGVSTGNLHDSVFAATYETDSTMSEQQQKGTAFSGSTGRLSGNIVVDRTIGEWLASRGYEADWAQVSRALQHV
ncbi:MAG TPA: hypothetical protein VGM08_02085 [Candidatus Saccharimonadales bacterium]